MAMTDEELDAIEREVHLPGYPTPAKLLFLIGELRQTRREYQFALERVDTAWEERDAVIRERDEFRKELSRGIKPTGTPDLLSSGDLPPDEADDMRSEPGRIPGLDVKKEIEDLKRKYQSG